MKKILLSAGFVLVGMIVGCRKEVEPTVKKPAANSPPAPTTPAQEKTVPLEPKKIKDEAAGLHNLIQVTDELISGSEPHGEEGFASLAKLGIKTVISVDGARPKIEEARKNGIRYVHIPIGYDGVPEKATVALARAMQECKGPIYIHCHHGKHRGPAAAAVACIASGKASSKEALKILETAGTGKEYAGLWRDVESYKAPPADSPVPELSEIAKVESLAAAMASMDRHWDNLKLCRDAKWEAPKDHPDLVPSQEALLLREALHEANRTIQGGKFSDQFKEWLAEAEALVAKLESSLKESQPEEAGKQITALEKSCKQCHVKYRN